MRKNVFLQLSFAVAAIVAGVLAYGKPAVSEEEIILMENVEALSRDEGEQGKGVCYNSVTTAPNCKVLYCGGCVWVEGVPSGENKGYCN